MEFKVISDVCIKPAHPTPSHLRHLKLSALDQLLPFPYVSIVFFFRRNDSATPHDLQLLKTSLSEILPKFYPLAGRINDELSIDCADEGVRYIEAQVNSNLTEFMNKPDLSMINKFLPVDPSFVQHSHVANAKITVFECGAISIGLCISHKVLDGAGLGLFVKMWAAAARGEISSLPNPDPNFDSPSVFPTNSRAKTWWLRDASSPMWAAVFRPGKFVTKRFVFSPPNLEKLRNDEAFVSETCGLSNPRPNRVVAVSALFWRSFIKASREKENGKKCSLRPSVLTHLVNLRRRADRNLPIADQTLCNLLWITPAIAPPDIGSNLSLLSGKVSAAISKIDSEFIDKLRGSEAEASEFVTESLRPVTDTGSSSGSGLITFSSWCRFGFYDVDFGSGKPVWVGCMSIEAPVFFNVVVLIETMDGEGIEAWVVMDEKDLDAMAADPELLQFASVDLNP